MKSKTSRPEKPAVKSVRTRDYRKMEAKLPPKIREMADALYRIFAADPHDKLLNTDSLNDTRRGRHRNGSYSVEITRRYRAIYVIDNGPAGDQEDQYCWYWVGTHESYNVFTGSKRR